MLEICNSLQNREPICTNAKPHLRYTENCGEINLRLFTSLACLLFPLIYTTSDPSHVPQHMLHGTCSTAHAPPLMLHRSWFTAHVSQHTIHGSCSTAHAPPEDGSQHMLHSIYSVSTHNTQEFVLFPDYTRNRL